VPYNPVESFDPLLLRGIIRFVVLGFQHEPPLATNYAPRVPQVGDGHLSLPNRRHYRRTPLEPVVTRITSSVFRLRGIQSNLQGLSHRRGGPDAGLEVGVETVTSSFGCSVPSMPVKNPVQPVVFLIVQNVCIFHVGTHPLLRVSSVVPHPVTHLSRYYRRHSRRHDNR